MTFYKITLSFLVRAKLHCLSCAAWLGSEGAYPQFYSYRNYNIKLFFHSSVICTGGAFAVLEQIAVQTKSLKIVMDC